MRGENYVTKTHKHTKEAFAQNGQFRQEHAFWLEKCDGGEEWSEDIEKY